jgi:hypothetical protein
MKRHSISIDPQGKVCLPDSTANFKQEKPVSESPVLRELHEDN